MKRGFSPLKEPEEEMISEYRASPSTPQITTEAPVLTAKW